jgi:UbiD family decarboxylase
VRNFFNPVHLEVGSKTVANYYTKWIVVIDGDVDPPDLEQVIWALDVFEGDVSG